MSNLGIDLLLSEDGDLIIAENGDFLDTALYQSNNPTRYTFDGECCLRESQYRVLSETMGEYNPFDVFTGAGAENLVSTSEFDAKFVQFKERVEKQLQRDDRVKFIEDISYERIGSNSFKIMIKEKIIGVDKISQLVFPFA